MNERRRVTDAVVSALRKRGFTVKRRDGVHMVIMELVCDDGTVHRISFGTNWSSHNRSSQNTISRINRILRGCGIHELPKRGW